MKLDKGKFNLIKYYDYVIVIPYQMLMMTSHYSKQNNDFSCVVLMGTANIPQWCMIYTIINDHFIELYDFKEVHISIITSKCFYLHFFANGSCLV